MRAIKNSAQAQAQLVHDILDVSRIISGNLILHLGPVGIASVIEAALEAVRPAATAKGIELTTTLVEMPPIVVDRDRVQQVMWNLLSNAIKFTPRGGSVRVETRWSADDVVIVVADSGQGIEPAFLPHVFERFTQEDASASRVHGGLGLGMAIVRHLTELHGGTVAVESSGKDQGATFTVLLPRTVQATRSADARMERRTVNRRDAFEGQPLDRSR
jgi:signal transduction histidine kinase